MASAKAYKPPNITQPCRAEHALVAILGAPAPRAPPTGGCSWVLRARPPLPRAVLLVAGFRAGFEDQLPLALLARPNNTTLFRLDLY